ncbi:MAG TPA: SRPBCC domain-containing protein [Terriglobales bacterium]|jgi:activator of HSP90 ATPase|nr:SRPBCC domain-containing protein [Terriglobales bacterium]
MRETENRQPLTASSRRQVIVRGAAAAASLVLTSTHASAQEQMPETQSTGPDRARTSLHQEVDLKATPHRIYDILLDSKLFADFSREPAEVSREVGGAFSIFGARIVGRNVELVPDQRIVQAWRPATWNPGEYSLVKFELKAQGPQTRVVLDHWGFHEGDFGHFDSGWHDHYWDRLAKYLA